MHDVIIVGARVAGAATAMLLARRGLKVLVVDRATFPSDTLSTHQVQVPGVARLARWGVLDAVLAAGTPPTREVRFDQGDAVFDGAVSRLRRRRHDVQPAPARLLDKVLVDAARRPVRRCGKTSSAEELLRRRHGDRHPRPGEGLARVTEQARLVIGADGKHSMVARAVGAPQLPRQAAAVDGVLHLLGRRAGPGGGELYAGGRQRRWAPGRPTTAC